MQKILANILSSYPVGRREYLIPILQEVQKRYGYLPGELISDVAGHLKMPSSKVHSVATFYNQFSLQPRSKFHILCCNGCACHLEDSAGILAELKRNLGLEEGHSSGDGNFSLEVVPCLGLCHLAPAVVVNGKVYGKLHRLGIAEFIERLLTEEDAG